MKAGIYLITNVINNKKYVGKTKSLKRRRYQHWRFLKNGNHPNLHLQSSYERYGEESFSFEVLEYVEIRDKSKDPEGYREDCKYLTRREVWWTDLLDCMSPKGYVLIKGGGQEISEEERKRRSVFMRGKQLHLGYTHSEKTRVSISTSLEGYRHTPEAIARMSTAQKGHPVSEETKIKISASISKVWEVWSPIGEVEVIENLNQFCRSRNLHNGSMYRVAQGKRNHYRGWRVRRYNEKPCA